MIFRAFPAEVLPSYRASICGSKSRACRDDAGLLLPIGHLTAGSLVRRHVSRGSRVQERAGSGGHRFRQAELADVPDELRLRLVRTVGKYPLP